MKICGKIRLDAKDEAALYSLCFGDVQAIVAQDDDYTNHMTWKISEECTNCRLEISLGKQNIFL
jgi:hypothetical protein